MKRRRVTSLKTKPRMVLTTRRRAIKKCDAAIITARNNVYRLRATEEITDHNKAIEV